MNIVQIIGHVDASGDPAGGQPAPQQPQKIELEWEPDHQTVAFLVRKGSPRYDSGQAVVCYRITRTVETMVGHDAVVRVAGRVNLIGRVMRGKRRNTYRLRMADQTRDITPEWVGEIVAIVPPTQLRAG